MKKVGCSEKEWNGKIVEAGCEKELTRKLKDIYLQEWGKKLEESENARKLIVLIGNKKGANEKE